MWFTLRARQLTVSVQRRRWRAWGANPVLWKKNRSARSVRVEHQRRCTCVRGKQDEVTSHISPFCQDDEFTPLLNHQVLHIMQETYSLLREVPSSERGTKPRDTNRGTGSWLLCWNAYASILPERFTCFVGYI